MMFNVVITHSRTKIYRVAAASGADALERAMDMPARSGKEVSDSGDPAWLPSEALVYPVDPATGSCSEEDPTKFELIDGSWVERPLVTTT